MIRFDLNILTLQDLPDFSTAPRAEGLELHQAIREAGYEVRGGKLVNAKTGEPFTIEFLLASPTFERIILF